MENEWPTYKQTSLTLAADNARINGELQTIRNDTSYMLAMIRSLEEKSKQRPDVAAMVVSEAVNEVTIPEQIKNIECFC